MLDKILKFLKIHLSSSLTLRDGTRIELSGTLDTGVNAFIVTDDGNISMPDGEYSLEDDTIILIKDGVIVDLIKAGTNLSSETIEKVELKISPEAGESENDFIGRCIKYEMDKNGYPQEQATAICYSKWEQTDMKAQPIEEVEKVEEKVELTTETTETTEPIVEELQKGNPEVSGEVPLETIEEKEEGKEEEKIEEVEPEDTKIIELESKISSLETSLNDIMEKLNLISEKFSAAQPIIKKKEIENYQSTFPEEIKNKVELIKKLKKS